MSFVSFNLSSTKKQTAKSSVIDALASDRLSSSSERSSDSPHRDGPTMSATGAHIARRARTTARASLDFVLLIVEG